MRTINSPELYRNLGFWNEETQIALLDTEIAIAGNGGTGNLFGMELARIGIQKFRIADPETFDLVNSNRVMGARIDTIGRNKAEVLKEDILKINPDAEVIVYKEGITEENIEDFLSTVDIVLNGIELTRPELGVMLARQARRRRIGNALKPIPMIDVEYIGHAGQGTVFDPESSMTFEKFMGIEGGNEVPLDEIVGQKVYTNRYLAYLPPYSDLRTLSAVQNGSPLPSNMIGAGVAAQIGLSEVLKLVRNKIGERTILPTYAPSIRWYDAYTNRGGVTRHTQLSYYKHLSGMILTNLLKRNDQASYTKEERALRGDDE